MRVWGLSCIVAVGLSVICPQRLTLRSDDRLGIAPAPELASLRRKHLLSKKDVVVTPDRGNLPVDVKGDCLEIVVEFQAAESVSFGMDVLCSPDGGEKTTIGYDADNKRVFSGDKGGDFELTGDERSFRFHMFLDRSVVEVYANERECITTRVYPKRPDCLGLNLFARGAAVKVVSLDIWQMESIW